MVKKEVDRENPDIWEDETPPFSLLWEGDRAGMQKESCHPATVQSLEGPGPAPRPQIFCACNPMQLQKMPGLGDNIREEEGYHRHPKCLQKGSSKRECPKHPKRGRSGFSGHPSSPFPREPPIHDGQNFPSPAKQASSITLPGTKVFLMLSSIDSHNDSLAGVPGCAPLP